MKKKIKKPIIDIGWREWISLVDFKNFYLKAKIDTGATISALHATHIEEFNFKGVKYVKFRLYQSKSYKMIKKPVVGYKMIKNSFGKKQLRPLINISIKIGNNTIDTIITLTTRSRMTYPVLIGRSTLNNNYRINPRKSFLTGKLD
ncbi:ATP-dependent zinc protease [bacterium]|nr:MAG: ATP-dependent zinc protease [bacterium]